MDSPNESEKEPSENSAKSGFSAPGGLVGVTGATGRAGGGAAARAAGTDVGSIDVGRLPERSSSGIVDWAKKAPTVCEKVKRIAHDSLVPLTALLLLLMCCSPDVLLRRPPAACDLGGHVA